MKHIHKKKKNTEKVFSWQFIVFVVVVYHVTIVAIGHGLLKKFWPMVIGWVLRTAGSSIVKLL